jgi:hypothetical protein
MSYARVVAFEGVNKERIEQMKQEMSGDGPPEDIPASEFMLLHDPENDRSLAVLFFENEDDYRRGDATLDAMPAGDTPGRRTSVTKYDVAVRMVTERQT